VRFSLFVKNKFNLNLTSDYLKNSLKGHHKSKLISAELQRFSLHCSLYKGLVELGMFLFLRRNFVEHFFQREIEILRSATSDSVKDFAVQFPVLNGRFFVVELGVVKMAGFLVFMSPEHEHRQTPNQESL